MIHFVSAKEACLSSRTYHTALADWRSGQQKNKLMSLGCEYLAAPHCFNGSQQYQFTERRSSPPGTIYHSVYCAQMRPFILLEFNFGFLSKRQRNLNSESVPIIKQQWIKSAQCDCDGYKGHSGLPDDPWPGQLGEDYRISSSTRQTGPCCPGVFVRHRPVQKHGVNEMDDFSRSLPSPWFINVEQAAALGCVFS